MGGVLRLLLQHSQLQEHGRSVRWFWKEDVPIWKLIVWCMLLETNTAKKKHSQNKAFLGCRSDLFITAKTFFAFRASNLYSPAIEWGQVNNYSCFPLLVMCGAESNLIVRFWETCMHFLGTAVEQRWRSKCCFQNYCQGGNLKEVLFCILLLFTNYLQKTKLLDFRSHLSQYDCCVAFWAYSWMDISCHTW